MKTKKSITDIDGDIIPVKRKIKEYSYHNKKLRDFNSDEFAEMIFDFSDSQGNFLPGNDEVTKQYNIHYLDYIPKSYARVYLYGVFELIKDGIRVFDKFNK